jgi:hypothetical protein
MNTPELSYPRAPQIEANPQEAEDYIASLVKENQALRAALQSAVTDIEVGALDPDDFPWMDQARSALSGV